MEGEEVDWAYYDIIVEITKPSHSKEIIDMTIDGSTLVFNYKPNQCGQYIVTAYLNRYKPDEAALDVKIFEGVRWSWCADNDDDEITTFNLSGNISYGSINLNNYYTKQEIDDKLEDISVGDVDLTSYATKEWVGNKYQPKGNYQPAGNYLTSIPSEYITETELETRLEKIDIPDTDLSGYYTKSEVDDKIDNIDIPTVDLSDYATKSWTTANYQPKGNYQPAGNYLTSIPSEYITETELETRLEKIDIPDTDLSGYYTKSEVDDKIDNIDIPTVDLTDYATEQWVEDKGYLTSVPAEYVTETELNNKGYITSIPSNYVTGDGVTNIRKMTQAAYNTITPNENTLYIIVG